MDYLTMEVEIDHGKVSSRDSQPLPEKATGLLTIIQTSPPGSKTATFLQTLESLQRHLGMDAVGAQKWMESVRDARQC